jgi:Class III cytochrome C family
MAVTLMASLCASPLARAATGLERLVMPGAVIQAHAKVEDDCAQCHVSFDKAAQPRVCLACHEDVAKDMQAHRGLHGKQSEAQCRSCHTEHKGRDAAITELDVHRFDHARTDFLLSGKHLNAECTQCHAADARYREAGQSCIACHQRDDAHATRLGRDCASCHDSNGWKVEKFDHGRTAFTLNAGHAQVLCNACHTKPFREQRLTQDCASCHRKDDAHHGALGQDCAQCHRDTTWQDTRFDHRTTGFTLLGRHANATCQDCHRGAADFKGAAKTCIGCHREDDKHANTLGSDCGACHAPAGWKPSRGFDHALSRFPLTGKHRSADCGDCHADAKHYRGIAHDCVSCHRDDDTHKGRNGERCADCHASDDWKRSLFQHDRQTLFPLRGAHQKLNCDGCHKVEIRKEKLPMTCVGCHRDDDPHRGDLGTDCASCHGDAAWKPSRFDHDKVAFVLLGAHRVLKCDSCHATQRYKDVGTGCGDCHKDDDAHRGALGADCARCHNSRDWLLGEFDHRRETRFVLDGAHAAATCSQCHSGVQPGAPRIASECASCHSGDDVHEGAFGRQCARCHSTDSFRNITQKAAGGVH